jgi:hypothetical protein
VGELGGTVGSFCVPSNVTMPIEWSGKWKEVRSGVPELCFLQVQEATKYIFKCNGWETRFFRWGELGGIVGPFWSLGHFTGPLELLGKSKPVLAHVIEPAASLGVYI